MFHGKKQKKGGWSNWVSHHCAILCHKLPGATCQVLAEASIDFSRCSVVAPETRSSESGESEGGFWGRFPRKNDVFLLQETSTFEKTLKFFLCLIVDWFFVIYVHSVGMIVVYFLIESKVKPNQSILVIWQTEKSDWWPLLAFFSCGMPMSLSRLSFIGRVGQSRILRKPISKFTLQ